MKQVKPEVIGYRQIGFMGDEVLLGGTLDSHDLIIISKGDFKRTGIKSKFRPVYKQLNNKGE
ncbi:hypothetical protein N9878_01100 [bacterium]|nr:hypothetical protein [bacterium]